PVTRPPMNRRGKVAQTRRTASRCGQTEIAGARADRAPSWAFIFLKPAAALMGARGGGLGAVHSRVLACQGFLSAFLPAHRLQTKLNRKINCDAPSKSALTVMNTFQCCTGSRNSYWVGL